MGSRDPVPMPSDAQLEAYAARLAQRAAEPEDELPLRLLEWRARDWYAEHRPRQLGASAPAQLSEAQADHLVGVIQAVIGGLDLSVDQAHQARAIATEALRQVVADQPDWPDRPP